MDTVEVVSLMGQVKTAWGTESEEAKDLISWIQSTREFYPWILSNIRYIKKRVDKGDYDPILSVKLWKHLVDKAMQSHDYKVTYGDWRPTPQNRMEVAKYLSEYYYEDLMSGEYNHMFEKKSSQTTNSSEQEEESDADSTEKQVIEALHKAGMDDDNFRYALGEQWVAKVVSSVVEQIVGRPQLFQTMVDGIIDRIKARL